MTRLLSKNNRRGMILMLVLAMLSMFAMLIVTFMLATNHLRRTSEAMGTADSTVNEAEVAREAAGILLSGSSSNSSVVAHHSILENLYGQPASGNDLLRVSACSVASGRWSDTTPNLFMVEFNGLFGMPYEDAALTRLPGLSDMNGDNLNAVAPTTADLMGTVLTVTALNSATWTAMSNAQRNAYEDFLLHKSFRIVYCAPQGAIPAEHLSGPLGNAGLLTNYALNADVVVLAETESGRFMPPPLIGGWNFQQLLNGCDFVVNGAPFSGTGPGYTTIDPDPPHDPLTSADAAQILKDSDGVPYALRPNPTAPNADGSTPYLNALRNGFVQMNPDYTAPDLATLFLGWYDMDPVDPVDTATPGKVRDIIPSFHRPQLVDYWLNKPGTTMDATLLRKIVLRPLPLDHPEFTGSNPTLAYDVIDRDANENGTSEAAELAGRFSFGPLDAMYDVDNDGDTIPDGYWMDIGMSPVTIAGQLCKPLVSFFIVDMDGRINLNAHGGWMEDATGADSFRNNAIRKIDNDDDTIPDAYYSNYENNADIDVGPIWNYGTGTDFRGEGAGPAEVRLDSALSKMGVTDTDVLRNILRNIFGAHGPANTFGNASGRLGRYGMDASPPSFGPTPGSPQTYTLRDIYSLREYPFDGDGNTFYNAFAGAMPDLFGQGTVTIDPLGNRVNMAAAPFDFSNNGIWGVPASVNAGAKHRDNSPGNDPGLPVLFDNPYLFDPNGSAGGADEPFTAAELEAILRVQDFDLSSLPPRLLAILTNQLDYQVGYPSVNNDGTPDDGVSDLRTLRKMSRYVTTASNDIPSPPRYLGPRAPGIFSLALKCAGEDRDAADTIIQRLPPEVFEGRRVDLNRLAKDADVVAPVDTARYVIGLKKRAKFAEEIFTLLMLLSHEQFTGYTEPGVEVDETLAGDANESLRKRWMVTRLAQWSVNLVDYLDPDDASTPFVFDLNPFDGGWASDANTFRFIDGDDTVIGAVKAGESGTKKINLVWGMERSNILISETMALHNRRVADSKTDTGNSMTTKDPEDDGKKDETYDQVYPPEPSLFVELYNAADPNRPDHAANGGVNLVRNGRSIYRLLVGEKTFKDKYSETQNTFDGEDVGRSNIASRLDPANPKNQRYSFSVQPRQLASGDLNDMNRSHVLGPSVASATEEIEIDRVIWFHPSANTTDVENTGLADRSYWNTNTPTGTVNDNTFLKPNQYLVIGPREKTYLASKTNLGGPPDHPTIAGEKGHPAQTINLSSLNVRKANVVLDDAGIASDYLTLAQARYRAVKTMIAEGNNGIGVNISGPYNSDTGYYNPDALEELGDEDTAEPKISPPADTPYDMETGNPVADDGIYGTGTVPSYKPLFLQRLADPNRPYHAITNPFLTVDWTMLDLTIYNGEEDTGDGGNDAEGEIRTPYVVALRPSNESTLLQSNPVIASRQIGMDTGGGTVRNLWSRTSLQTDWKTAPTNDEGNADTCSTVLSHALSNLNSGNNCTFGFLNYGTSSPLRPRQRLPDDHYTGAPSDGTDPVPFRVYPWNDAPFANTYDAMHVPASAPGRFGVEYLANVAPVSGYATDGGNVGSLGLGTCNEHLLNFFCEKAGTGSVQSLDLVRFFDLVGIPSRFAGTVKPLDDGAGNIVGGVYTHREPGRINVNTMSDVAWEGLTAARGGNYPSSFDEIDQSRRKISPASSDPDMFMQPFRSASAGALVPDAVMEPVLGATDATLFRHKLNGGSSSSEGYFVYPPGGSPEQSFSTRHQFDRLNRLAEMTTTRSNVFAVWMTVGFFEVTHYNNQAGYSAAYPAASHINSPAMFNAVFPDGYVLGKECGTDGEAVESKRIRSFMLIDRSKPAGFRRGESLNAFENTVQVFRILND